MHEPYALEPEVNAPNLPGGAVVRPTFEALIEPLAAELYLHAGSCVRNFGDFHVALTAGESELGVLLRLMIDPAYRWLPWKHTHVWMLEDDTRASGMGRVAELLRGHAGIPDSRLHAVRGGEGHHLEDAAAQYERELQTTLAWREKGHDRLDYALTSFTSRDGLGLAATQPKAGEGGRLVRADAGTGRVSMTSELVRSTRLITVIARGAGAADGVRALAAGDHTAIEAVRPVGGSMRWYVDSEACP